MSSNNIVNVVVVRKRDVQISTNATAGIIDSTNPVVAKNNPTMYVAGGGVDKLTHLLDVDAAGKQEGDSLVYQANTNMYVVKQADLNYITGEVDGGTF